MIFYPEEYANLPSTWTGYTLLMPVVSVGNVGQLSIDLLLSTLLNEKRAERIGRMNTPALRPMVGPNAYDLFSSSPTTSAVVYLVSSLRLVILQVRSPPFHEARKLFVAQLTDYIVSSDFQKVVVLSSAFSQFLPNPYREMSTEFVLRYSTSSGVSKEHEQQLVSAGVYRIPRVNKCSFEIVADDDANGTVRIAGSGISKLLLQSLEAKNSKLPVVLLVAYCSEGDNTPEAVKLTHWVIKHVLLNQQGGGFDEGIKLTTPISWSKFFGEEIPNMLF